jgi:hypothetical protein
VAGFIPEGNTLGSPARSQPGQRRFDAGRDRRHLILVAEDHAPARKALRLPGCNRDRHPGSDDPRYPPSVLFAADCNCVTFTASNSEVCPLENRAFMKVRFVETVVLVAALSRFSCAESCATGMLRHATGAAYTVANSALNFSPWARGGDNTHGGPAPGFSGYFQARNSIPDGVRSPLASSALTFKTFKESARAMPVSEGSELGMLAMGAAGILIAMRKKFR